MDRKYEIAGTSYYKRVMTFRFADGSAKVREGVLRRAGHEDIQLHQLPTPMTKEAASAWLTQQGLSRGAVMPWGHRICISEYLHSTQVREMVPPRCYALELCLL